MDEKFSNTTVSRRAMLKGMAATVASAAMLSGCSSGEVSDEAYLTPKDGLVYDTELKRNYSTGAYNCGSRCKHQIWHKNGRIMHLTSAGDIPREGSFEKDNSCGEIGNPVQRRACVRGYSYIQRLYQPDRLKYPMIQKGERGDVSGFVRVDWPTAIKEAARVIKDAIDRKATLGYTPLMVKWIFGLDTFCNLTNDPKVAPVIVHLGNESTGACDAAKFDMVGPNAMANSVKDRLNSNFIITWGLDPSRTTYHITHAHWVNTCCKEQGTEMVVITPNYSDTAGMISTGVKDFNYSSITGTHVNVTIPGWIPCRPSTDGALAVAMAYAIYKNNWHDAPFLTDKCFGFFPNQTVENETSHDALAPMAMMPGLGTMFKNIISPADFMDDDTPPKHFSAGSTYSGAVFTVPPGESFVEYLNSLEVTWAGESGALVPGGSAGSFPQPAAPTTRAVYEKVLAYAASLTGVPADTIEALAYKYSHAKPGFLDVGGGPQRAWNGVEWVQMMISLCAMTGDIIRAGGGQGYSMMAMSDEALTRGTGAGSPDVMLPNVESTPGIYVPMNEWAQVALTGKDYRSEARFIEDVKITAGGLDLSGRGKLVEIDAWYIGGYAGYNGLTTLEDINKTVRAIKSVKNVICCDHTMTPTATYSTIVLPVPSHYEYPVGPVSQKGEAIYLMDTILKEDQKLFDTKHDYEIQNLIMAELRSMGVALTANDYTIFNGDYQAAYAARTVPGVHYTTIVDPDAASRVPSFEDFRNNLGVQEFPIPKGAIMPVFELVHKPGTLRTTTGRINFYQPLWGKIRPKTAKTYTDPLGIKYDGFRNPTACYEPNAEGYEKFFKNNDPRDEFLGYEAPGSHRRYPLFYMTNKARNRAHTVFDNVAMIKDQFEQVVHINPQDAATRGIKDNDKVYVYNDRGCTYLTARVTHYIIPGVISIEHGSWYRPSSDENEEVTIWQDDTFDSVTREPIYTPRNVRVDINGAENVLTLGRGTTEQYVGQAISAQGGPCEVSLTKPPRL